MSAAHGQGRDAHAAVTQDARHAMTRAVEIGLQPNRRQVRLWPTSMGMSLWAYGEEDDGTPPNFPEDRSPTLTLPEDEALALYHALAEHFGHAPNDMRTTREDLLHERKRVDKMIDHLLIERSP